MPISKTMTVKVAELRKGDRVDSIAPVRAPAVTATVLATHWQENLCVFSLLVDGRPYTYVATPSGTDLVVHDGQIEDAIILAEVAPQRADMRAIADALEDLV